MNQPETSTFWFCFLKWGLSETKPLDKVQKYQLKIWKSLLSKTIFQNKWCKSKYIFENPIKHTLLSCIKTMWELSVLSLRILLLFNIL